MIRVEVPGDKSVSQRALILASLAEGESRIRGLLMGEDPAACASVLRALGSNIPPVDLWRDEIGIIGRGSRGLQAPGVPLDCGNSGTCARLMLGVLAGQGFSATLEGDRSLRARPMSRVTEPLARMGARFAFHEAPGRLPVTVSGGDLIPVDHRSDVASAQVKSALLLAGLVGQVEVGVTEPELSRDHTERMLAAMGCEISNERDGELARIRLHPSGEPLRPLDLDVPKDFSSAAFFLVLGAILQGGPGIELPGVGLNPTRAGMLPVLRRMGVEIAVEPVGHPAHGEPLATLRVSPSELKGIEVGPSDRIASFIDEVPALAVAAATAAGETAIRGAGELRVKETDRIRAIALNLRSIGVEAEELDDGLVIRGRPGPLSGQVEAFGDHRIAMAFGMLGALPGNAIEIDDPDVVEVSFPGFWAVLRRITEAAERGPAAGGGAGPVRRQGDPAGQGERDPDAGASPRLVVTIDGPAGSGKTSTASAVARRLGVRHLDSGALYRALTLALLETGTPPDRWEGLGEDLLSGIEIDLVPADPGFGVRLDGRRVDEELRTPTVNEHVSLAARLPVVRDRLIGLQRSAATHGPLVAEGRDLGTVVFPDAETKVFLVADLAERARRRFMESGGREPSPEELATEQRRLAERDRMDTDRPIAPLRQPEGALVIDTTALSLPEQTELIVERARRMLRGEAH